MDKITEKHSEKLIKKSMTGKILPKDTTQFKDGNLIFIKTLHNTYLRAKGFFSYAIGQSKTCGTNELFTVVHQNNKIGFKTSRDKFMSARKTGKILQMKNFLSWEEFQLEIDINGNFKFKSHHGKYLSAPVNGGNCIANKTDLTSTQTFQVTIVQGLIPKFKITLHNCYGDILYAKKHGDWCIICKNKKSKWSYFLIEKVDKNNKDTTYISLKTHHNRYISMNDIGVVEQVKTIGRNEIFEVILHKSSKISIKNSLVNNYF